MKAVVLLSGETQGDRHLAALVTNTSSRLQSRNENKNALILMMSNRKNNLMTTIIIIIIIIILIIMRVVTK